MRLAPEQQREAWSLAAEAAPDGKPTARLVEAAAEMVAPRRREPEADEEIVEVVVPKGHANGQACKPLPGQTSFLEPAPDPARQAADRWIGWLRRLNEDLNLVLVSIPRREGFGNLGIKWPRDKVHAAIAQLKKCRDEFAKGISELENLQK